MNLKIITCAHCHAHMEVGNSGNTFRIKCPSCGTILSSDTGKPWKTERLYIFDNSRSPAQRKRKGDNIVLWMFGLPFGLIAIIAIIMGIGQGTRKVQHMMSDSTTQSVSHQPKSPATQSWGAATNYPKIDTVLPSHTLTKSNNATDSSKKQQVIDFAHPLKASNARYMNSLIDSSRVVFDENLQPIATIKLYNKGQEEITQVVFKFAFAQPDELDGSMSPVADECSVYTKASVDLKPGEHKTGRIQIPEPSRKEMDTPIITIIKVRYANGNMISLND